VPLGKKENLQRILVGIATTIKPKISIRKQKYEKD